MGPTEPISGGIPSGNSFASDMPELQEIRKKVTDGKIEEALELILHQTIVHLEAGNHSKAGTILKYFVSDIDIFEKNISRERLILFRAELEKVMVADTSIAREPLNKTIETIRKITEPGNEFNFTWSMDFMSTYNGLVSVGANLGLDVPIWRQLLATPRLGIGLTNLESSYKSAETMFDNRTGESAITGEKVKTTNAAFFPVFGLDLSYFVYRGISSAILLKAGGTAGKRWGQEYYFASTESGITVRSYFNRNASYLGLELGGGAYFDLSEDNIYPMFRSSLTLGL